ncbi:MAG: phosphatase PAP2 family protein [Deltaproteobacteria bacterium]|nr:phosphatase PAP2 family protein [Deltaproteobacteria bacterium]
MDNTSSPQSSLISRKERLAIILVITATYFLYHPIAIYTNTLSYYAPVTPLDTWMPLSPIWTYIYAFIFLITVLPTAFINERKLFHKMAIAYVVVQCVAFSIFVLFPVRMTLRPDTVDIDSFHTWGLQLCYFIDKPVNCCPSLHVAMAFLGALCTFKADRFIGGLCIALAVAISLSTMLVKQHFILDVMVGLAVSTLSYKFLVDASPYNEDPAHRGRNRRYAGLLFGAYSLAIAGLFVAYKLGWAPWQPA